MSDQREFRVRPSSQRITFLSASFLLGFGIIAHVLIDYSVWPIVGGVIMLGLWLHGRRMLVLRLHHDHMEVRTSALAGRTSIRYPDITGIRLGSRDDDVQLTFRGADGAEELERFSLSVLDTEMNGAQFKELIERFQDELQRDSAAA